MVVKRLLIIRIRLRNRLRSHLVNLFTCQLVYSSTYLLYFSNEALTIFPHGLIRSMVQSPVALARGRSMEHVSLLKYNK